MPTCLLSKLLVCNRVAIGASQRLLQKGEQNRNDDDGLESLAENHEEDGHGKDGVGTHDEDMSTVKPVSIGDGEGSGEGKTS